MEIPYGIPAAITAGDTLQFKLSEPNYPAGDGYTLNLVFINEICQHKLIATADGDDHYFNIPTETTAAYTAGEYEWHKFATTADGARYSLGSGTITITPDLVAATNGHDNRSLIKQTLDALQQAVHSKATMHPDQLKMKVGDKEIGRMSYGELIKAIKQYKAWHKQEQRKADRAVGIINANNKSLRFGNVWN